jgi:serine protease Do
MRKKKIKKLAYLTGCFYLVGISLFVGIGNPAEVYSLPVAEMESILIDWFSQSGFTVRSSPADMGKVKLNAVRGKEHLEIHLKPHSALATDVQIEAVNKAKSDSTLPEKMAAYIRGYIKASAKKDRQNPSPAPEPVLSQVNSTVCIQAFVGDKKMQISGFFINSDGLIICTTHDLETFQKIKVILPNGYQLPGELIKFDSAKDLALIRCPWDSANYVKLHDSRSVPKLGERIYSVGCPVNLIGSIHSGFISGPPRKANQMPFWQAAIETHPGSSGSPVFDSQGKLIGIIKGRYRGTNSIGFLIPLDTILSFVRQRQQTPQ